MKGQRQEEITRMMSGHLLGTLSEEEQEALQLWCEESPENMAFFNHVCRSRKFGINYNIYKSINQKEAFSAFVKRTNVHIPLIRRMQPLMKYAAIVLLVLTAGIGIYLGQKQLADKENLANTLIGPGQPKAILVLEDGSQVSLSGDSTEHIRSGSKTLATKTASGISYDQHDMRPTKGYNTLSIPRGGEYRVTLSDGTVVHLNSDSELKYPASFQSNKQREVYLKGEGYFEVAKNPRQAFVVHVGEIKVKQYGTAFNINAHAEGLIKVVLVHGSIGVSTQDPNSERKLKVSQLAEYKKDNRSFSIRNVDVRPYVAWNEGMFNFEDENLNEIMQTLSLWYDVDIHFDQNELKNLRFTGSIRRTIPINDILNAIASTTDVQMKIKGRDIHINKSE